MKVKLFHIRLTKEHSEKDQEILNLFMSSVSVKKTKSELIQGTPNFWTILVYYSDSIQDKNSKSTKLSIENEDELTEEEKNIYNTLKIWRNDKARSENIANYMICHNSELMSVSSLKPKELKDFYKIKGFGEHKTTKHGEEIIEIIKSLNPN